jgi:hypothetical protein
MIMDIFDGGASAAHSNHRRISVRPTEDCLSTLQLVVEGKIDLDVGQILGLNVMLRPKIAEIMRDLYVAVVGAELKSSTATERVYPNKTQAGYIAAYLESVLKGADEAVRRRIANRVCVAQHNIRGNMFKVGLYVSFVLKYFPDDTSNLEAVERFVSRLKEFALEEQEDTSFKDTVPSKL